MEGVEAHGPFHAAQLMDDAAADIRTPEDAGEVAFGFGGLDALFDMLQKGIEQELAGLLLDFLETPGGFPAFCPGGGLYVAEGLKYRGLIFG